MYQFIHWICTHPHRSPSKHAVNTNTLLFPIVSVSSPGVCPVFVCINWLSHQSKIKVVTYGRQFLSLNLATMQTVGVCGQISINLHLKLIHNNIKPQHRANGEWIGSLIALNTTSHSHTCTLHQSASYYSHEYNRIKLPILSLVGNLLYNHPN